ncbi:MAG: hypothetical protein EPO32_14100, partial [Anaerolineae bacterium]
AEGRHGPGGTPSEPEIHMSGVSSTRRRRKLMQMLSRIGIVALIIGAVFGGWWILNNRPVTPDITPEATENVGAGTQVATQPAAVVTDEGPTEEPDPISTIDSTISPLFPGEEDVIAFSSNRSGSYQIWALAVSSGELFQITDIPGGACQPEWSPDGLRLVFTSPCRANQDVYLETRLYVINTDGTGLEVLPPGLGSSDASWSPDGRHLLFTQALDQLRTQIYRLDLETGESVYMSGEDGLNFHPVWSPDGTRFVFVSTRQGGYRLYIKENDPDFVALTLTRSAVNYVSMPVWTPDSLQIIFVQRSATTGVFSQLYRVSLEMLNISDILLYKENRVSEGQILEQEVDPDIHPDGFRIAYEGWPDGVNHDIWVMFVDGTNRTRLTDDEGIDFDPAWRPLIP